MVKEKIKEKVIDTISDNYEIKFNLYTLRWQMILQAIDLTLQEVKKEIETVFDEYVMPDTILKELKKRLGKDG